MENNIKNNGWIKLHRNLLDNPISKKPEYLSLWCHLLMMASHSKSNFIWNGAKHTLLPGQILTGRLKLSKITGIKQTTLERILKFLENEHQIGQQKTSKYRIITVLNWDQYQKVDSKMDMKRTTDGQQTDTYKNDNNEKNEKKSSKDEKIFNKWEKDILIWLEEKQVDNPRRYANSLFKKYGRKIVLKCSRDSTCETLSKLGALIEHHAKV